MERKELNKFISHVEYLPNVNLDLNMIEKKPSFSIDSLGTLGVSVKPLMELASGLSAKTGTSGFYFVNTKGKQMFNTAEGFIGSLKNINGGVGGGQARMLQIPFDPMSLGLSCAVMAIESKMNEIIEGQKEIFNFLDLKEKAQLRANIEFLVNSLNDYKFNLGNTRYIDSNLNRIQTIKNEAMSNMILRQSMLEKKVDKKVGLHFNNKTDEVINECNNELNECQLCVYIFAFSSFLEMMLIENFNSEYIRVVLNRINGYKDKYQLLYDKTTKRIEELTNSSISTKLISGTSKFSSEIGKVIKKSSLNEVIKADFFDKKSKELDKINIENKDKKIKLISEVNSGLLIPFESSINMIDKIYNKECVIAFNSEKVYLDVV